MPVKTTINKEKGIIYRLVTGNITIDELIFDYKETLKHPDYVPGYNTIDHLQVKSAPDISAADLNKIVDYLRSTMNIRGQGWKSAIVADSDLAFGMSRMYEQLADQLPYEIMVFRTLEEAEKWLFESD